jgi:uncharacterized protein
MPQNFISCDRDQAMLMPPSLLDWVPEDHVVWTILGAVDELDLSAFYGAYRADGHGRPAFAPPIVPAMATRRSGAVLIVSSTTGFQPAARYATYGAVKAFSLSFGQSLHAELRRSGVAVTTVCPGPVETDFFDVNHVQAVRLPRAMWTTADRVAGVALRGVSRNRRVVIPGAPMRALMASSRLSPAAVQLRVMDLLLPDTERTTT